MIALPRNAQLWLPGYLRTVWERRKSPSRPFRVWLVLADHYEPFWRTRDEALARERVSLWRKFWPEIAARHADSAGRPPRYTFFYPEEEYRPGLLDPLAEMAAAGIAQVEVHLHHDGEGPHAFVDRLSGFIETLSLRHGLLRREDGALRFGFIHGNWALDNSFPGGRWCGLNNEITLLRRLGCYADFTMPSAPSPTQARMINRIYWALDDPGRPKSYDAGVEVTPGGPVAGDLLMIPGPLGLRWTRRPVPRLETGQLAHHDPPAVSRVPVWLAAAPRIGRDAFLKLYTHGAQDENAHALLRGGLDLLFTALAAECRRRGCELYFASAWEMYRAIDALRREADPLERPQ